MSELSPKVTKAADELLGIIYRKDYECSDDAAEMIADELEESGLEFDRDDLFNMVEAWWAANEDEPEDEPEDEE